MISRLFNPVAFSRLFDPMPLPKRVRVTGGSYFISAGRVRPAVGRSRVPRNRVAPFIPVEALFSR